MTLFLFNWVGYRFLTGYLEEKADVPVEDTDYETSQLVSVKVPITHLSYYQNTMEFESVRGKIEIGGIQYKYVKRRIYNDSLEVLCIPDAMAMSLKAVKNKFFLFANDLHGTGQDKKQSANAEGYHYFSPDYYPIQDRFILRNTTVILTRSYPNDLFTVCAAYALVPERPPQAI